MVFFFFKSQHTGTKRNEISCYELNDINQLQALWRGSCVGNERECQVKNKTKKQTNVTLYTLWIPNARVFKSEKQAANKNKINPQNKVKQGRNV